MKEQIRVKIADLKHPEKNVRTHGRRQIEEFKRSVKMFGQIRPAIVDENNVVLVGNGLVTAMREDGYEEVEAIRYTGLSENQKKKLMIADNQIASLGSDNMDVIEEFIKSLDGDLDVPGYDEETLEMLVAESEAVTEEVMRYGVFKPEEVDEVAQQSQSPMNPVQQTYSPAQDRAQMPHGNPYPQAEEPMQPSTAETLRYVVCPHCGEKIYLE